MARTILPPAPFPDDIDRDYFAAYLSGFTDGEGCFRLGFVRFHAAHRKTPCATFQICLRADDVSVLRLTQSFFGCGFLSRQSGKGTRHDSFRFNICNTSHLASIVIPHFERFPLLAKKRSDYLVWKEGVRLIRQTMTIPITRAGHKGAFPRWTPPRLEHFCSLIETLKATRQYQAPAVPLPPPPRPTDPSLFD